MHNVFEIRFWRSGFQEICYIIIICLIISPLSKLGEEGWCREAKGGR